MLTLAHVAERADLSLTADGSGGEEPVGRTTSDGDLAIMRARRGGAAGAAAPGRPPSPGQPCSVAIVPDDCPRVQHRRRDRRGGRGRRSLHGRPRARAVRGLDGERLARRGPRRHRARRGRADRDEPVGRRVRRIGDRAHPRARRRAGDPTLSPSANAALGGAIAIATTQRQPSEAPDSPVDPISAPTAMLLGALRASADQRGPHGRRRPPRPRRRPPPGAATS